MHNVLTMMVAGLGAMALLSGSAMAGDEAAAKAEQKPAEPKIHIVAAGDSLSLIAEAEKLETWRPLWDANTELENPDLIYEGQKLIVPQGGTTERPLPATVAAPTPRPVAQTAQPARRASAAPAKYAAGTPGLMARIRMHESGGNYAINTGNGYYGAYQFNLATWRGVGGSGLPSEASPAEQDMRAQMLYDRRGCSPWPNTCY